MVFDPELAEVRFGYGLSPVVAAPAGLSQMLATFRGPDTAGAQFPIPGFADQLPHLLAARKMQRQVNKQRTDARVDAFRKHKRKMAVNAMRWAGQTMLRRAWSGDGLRERMVAFWADHFTARGKSGILRGVAVPYVEEAIRPHVTGRFSDLLAAAVMHPVMLHYLDQQLSVGENSKAARDNKRLDGLNENLAREVLELHTLGVGGPYTQGDVRQLAELFTGMSFDFQEGFRFRKPYVEPGAEQVLGRSYDGDGVAPILAALDDLALHPATARHIASKLAVHFVADDPEAGLVAHLTATYLATGGDLSAVTGALLEHPSAWGAARRNVKPPVDFMASAWRALAVEPAHVAGFEPRRIGRVLMRPLAAMGQPWMTPPGPDGWAEEDGAWITPQGVAARLDWAMEAPRLLTGRLPDPRGFVEMALGRAASAPVRFAAAAAESRQVAIGLVLAAPAFQRR